MTPVTLTEFLGFFPEFEGIDPSKFNPVALRANLLTRGFPGICGCDNADYRTLYLSLFTAHLLTIQKRTECSPGGNGAIKSVKSGDESITYAVPDRNDDWESWLALTPYGSELLYALNNTVPSAFLI